MQRSVENMDEKEEEGRRVLRVRLLAKRKNSGRERLLAQEDRNKMKKVFFSN